MRQSPFWFAAGCFVAFSLPRPYFRTWQRPCILCVKVSPHLLKTGITLHLLKIVITQQVLEVSGTEPCCWHQLQGILGLVRQGVTVETGFLTSAQTGLVILANTVSCTSKLTCLAVVRLEPVVQLSCELNSQPQPRTGTRVH